MRQPNTISPENLILFSKTYQHHLTKNLKYSLSSEKNKSARRPVVQTNNTVWNDTEEIPYAFKSMGRQAFTQKSAVQQNELLYAGGMPHAFDEESIAHSGRDVKDSLQNKSTERSVSPQKKVVRQNNSPDTEGVPHAFIKESIANSGQDVKYSLSNYDEEALPNDMELWDDDVWEIMEESTSGRMAEHADLSNASERSKKILEREGRMLKRAVKKLLGASRFSDDVAVDTAIKSLTAEYVKTGEVKTESIRQTFDTLYKETLIKDDTFYKENRQVRDEIRSAQLTISKEDSANIPDFNKFRQRALWAVRIAKEGLPVDVFKTICLDYKTKKRRKAKEDELIIFKNTHEAIIDEETWNNAQRLRKTVRRSPKYGTTSHPFTGLLICSDCGGKLSYREPAEHKEKKYDSDYSFVCQHYRHRKGTCSMHYIKVKTVNEILLKSIKEITDFAKEDKQEFLKLMNKLSDEKREEKYQRDKEKLEKLSSRKEELTTLITKLYEDHALGKIPAKHFDRLFNIYDTEQQDLEKQIQYFEDEIESYHQRKVDSDKFLKMIEKYTDIEELTVAMINEYIEKVVVHEATGGRKGKDRKQQVDLYFNVIGNSQVPQKADIEKMA